MSSSQPYADSSGWWSTFLGGSYSWRWYDEPHLYQPARLKYKPLNHQFTASDGMGRVTQSDRPFECMVNPNTGEFERLCVQSVDSVRGLENSTWDRTVIRNVAPKSVRFALLPFRLIPQDRRDHPSQYTPDDWLSVALLWIPSVLALFTAMFLASESSPKGKSIYSYLEFMHNDFRYPRLARNFRENRSAVVEQRHDDPSWSSPNSFTYRTLRPRRLCFLVKKTKTDRDGKLVEVDSYEPRFVDERDTTPYVFIAYTTDHFCGDDDVHMLHAMAMRATIQYVSNVADQALRPAAFWLADSCMPEDRYMDADGTEHTIDPESADYEARKNKLANHDVYSISDIIRGAQGVLILAGNPRRSQNDDPLKAWGLRAWTFPEVLLSKGNSITVLNGYSRSGKLETIPKNQFPLRAWPDPWSSRQLLDHFFDPHLSRLERIKIALECLMNRQLDVKYPGDRSYILMGLLRIRPPIDQRDSSFQAFARLSLPQDSDRLMERLICLLPNDTNEDWELMTDQYRSSLWDIYPDTQVCGIGENDTIVVDGCWGASIQWSNFTTVTTMTRLTLTRQIFLWIVLLSPVIFVTGCSIVAVSPVGGALLLLISLLVFQLPAPLYIWHLYGGKVWASEPCLFGIEGYVPIDVIEEKIFGANLNRLRWSPNGSPLSRHTEGDPCNERSWNQDPSSSLESATTIETYPVQGIDPCSNSPTTLAEFRTMSRSAMGEMKVFTLVDTLTMTVTLFKAARPPTVLVIGGSEGGMKRAIACSYDVTTGTLCRETVLRIPSECVSRMHQLPRIRLGLKRHFSAADVESSPPGWVGPSPGDVGDSCTGSGDPDVGKF